MTGKRYDLSGYDPDNPKVGDFRRKHHSRRDSDIQIYSACIDCGVKRWVNIYESKKRSGRCQRCSIINRYKIPQCDINNPKLGDMCKRLRAEGRASHIYIWSACPRCGKEEWHRRQKEGVAAKCKSCAMIVSANPRYGAENPRWKGGRVKRDGYVFIRINDPNHPYASNGYVAEHRLVMEKFLGRYLSPTEIIHHKNNIKDDNRLENLALISNPTHTQTIQNCKECGLRKEVRMLRWQIKELRETLQLKLINQV